mmetsp:Transcript_4165/g.10782  ORF Transcript_4165/g.10782 Transcript_4165/m.10782 type:complete len:276 (-) Transcript_4165:413-1240(-)
MAATGVSPPRTRTSRWKAPAKQARQNTLMRVATENSSLSRHRRLSIALGTTGIPPPLAPSQNNSVASHQSLDHRWEAGTADAARSWDGPMISVEGAAGRGGPAADWQVWTVVVAGETGCRAGPDHGRSSVGAAGEGAATDGPPHGAGEHPHALAAGVVVEAAGGFLARSVSPEAGAISESVWVVGDAAASWPHGCPRRGPRPPFAWQAATGRPQSPCPCPSPCQSPHHSHRQQHQQRRWACRRLWCRQNPAASCLPMMRRAWVVAGMRLWPWQLA